MHAGLIPLQMYVECLFVHTLREVHTYRNYIRVCPRKLTLAIYVLNVCKRIVADMSLHVTSLV